MQLSNANKPTIVPVNHRHCEHCSSVMLMVKCSPAYVGTNQRVYTCTNCEHTEKVTTVNKTFLYLCSKELRAPF